MKMILTLFFALFCIFNQIEARQIWMLFDSTNSIMEVNRVDKIIVDKEDNVWFTTAGYGLLNEYKANVYKYKNGQFTVYNPYKSILGRLGIINDLLIDPFGSLCIASQRIGVVRYANNNWKQHLFDTINDYSRNHRDWVKEIEIDNENNIWAGSYDGLYKLDLNMNRISLIYMVPLKRKKDFTIWSMIYDNKKNELWFSAVNEALFKMNGDVITRFDYDTLANFSGIDILSRLVLDSLGNIWFCATGLLQNPFFGFFDGCEFKIIDSNETGLQYYYLLPLGTDRFNNVWFSKIINIGINNSILAGLVKYDGKTWELFDTTNTSLPTNRFHSISFDSYNNIWLGTDKGLLVLNLGEDGVVLNVDEHTKPDNISVSPNPATDYIEVAIPPLERGLGGVSPVVKLFDVLGIEHPVSTMSFLRKQESPGNTDEIPGQAGNDSSIIRLDVSHLPPGVYFVQIGNMVQRFVKI